MKRLLFIPAIAGLLVAITPAIASANLHCPERSSIFGTVVRVHPTELTLKTIESRMGMIHVMTQGSHVTANGLPLRPGVFAGAYGCLTVGDRQFNAEDVTLATDANAYSAYPRRTQMIQGRIDTVESGRILIDSNQGHGDVWVYTTQSGFRKGQLVNATGSFDPMDAAFKASSITVAQQ